MTRMFRPHSQTQGFVTISTMLFVLFVAVFFAGIFSANATFQWLCAAWAILFILAGCGVIPRALSRRLHRGLSVVPASSSDVRSAIILLGAGTIEPAKGSPLLPAWEAHSRIEYTAELYLAIRRSGNFCTVIISGGDTSRERTASAPVYSTRLIALGVSESDILLENVGVNSFEHAKHSAVLINKCEFASLFLVTSGLHMKRALLYFAHFRIHPIPRISDCVTGILSPVPLGFNFAISEIAMHQFVGIWRFRIYNFLGLNK